MIKERFRPSRRLRAGFTLIEMTIVLLVVSFIVGGVWIAAAKTWNHYRVSRTVQQIIKITQNIREYYISTNQVPAGDITATLDGATVQLLPLEMRRNAAAGGPIDNAFNGNWPNGSFHIVGNPTVGGKAIVGFRMRLFGLNTDACIDLLLAVPASDADLGIVQVGTQNMVSGTTVLTSALTASTVAGWCNQAGANNELDWDFKLRN